MDETISLSEVLQLAEKLPVEDKVRLIERISPQIQRELRQARSMNPKSLRGLWRGLDITAEDIDEARKELWGKFPHEDI